MTKGVERIRENFPTWETEGGRGSYPFYCWYYASRAMYMAGGDEWKRWRAIICPLLLRQQNKDGSWDAAQDEKKVGTNYTTAVAVLILRLCSGSPPAYLRRAEPLQQRRYSCPQCLDDIGNALDAASGDARTKGQLIDDLRKLVERYRREQQDRHDGARPPSP